MIYWLSVFILKAFSKLYLSGTVIQRENLPEKGPYIGVVNHNSNMDVVAMAMAVKSPVHTMAKVELFKVPVLKWWLKAVHMFPVVRNSSDIAAFNKALDLLRNGEVLFIAPEGTRKRDDGQRHRPRTGFVRMAHNTDCPVVPVAIYGTDKVLPPGAWFPKPVKVVVKIGEPVKLEKVASNADKKEKYQEQANGVMDTVYSMYQEIEDQIESDRS